MTKNMIFEAQLRVSKEQQRTQPAKKSALINQMESQKDQEGNALGGGFSRSTGGGFDRGHGKFRKGLGRNALAFSTDSNKPSGATTPAASPAK